MNYNDDFEKTAQESLCILRQNPEIYEMSVLDFLNDNKDFDIKLKYGIAARMVISSITDYEANSLVTELTQYCAQEPLCSHIGYLLVTEKDILLEQLLISANSQNKLIDFLPYAKNNFKYENNFHAELFDDFIELLGQNCDDTFLIDIIEEYAGLILRFNEQIKIAEKLGDLKNAAELQLICSFALPWYDNNSEQVSCYIGELLHYSGALSKQAAIKYINQLLTKTDEEFRKYFKTLEELSYNNKQFWINAIPAYINFIAQCESPAKKDSIYAKALEHLEQIPDKSDEERRAFIKALIFIDEEYDDLLNIYNRIIKMPLGSGYNNIISDISMLYSHKLQKNNISVQAVLSDLICIFKANKNMLSARVFLQPFSAVIRKIKDKSELAEYSLKLILSKEFDNLVFGLELLNEVGNFSKLYQVIFISEDSLIYILKGYLYSNYSCDDVCKMSYQLLYLIENTSDKYVDFCLNEVFANYPGTMYRLAKSYSGDSNDLLNRLANSVIEIYDKEAEIYKQCLEIKDFMPSQKHNIIFNELQAEKMAALHKNAHKPALLDLITTRTIKYGPKMGSIIYGSDGKKFYQVNAFATVSASIELSSKYVNDPIGFEFKRAEFFKEVQTSEVDN